MCNVSSTYPSVLQLIKALHRRLTDVIRDEFERKGNFNEISSVQALFLYEIGNAGEITAPELRLSKYHLGSNISYNLKKLSEMGYIKQLQSGDDRRSDPIFLTKKGEDVYNLLDKLYIRHLETMEKVGDISPEDIVDLGRILSRLDRFWTNQILYRL